MTSTEGMVHVLPRLAGKSDGQVRPRSSDALQPARLPVL
jgi:hypothetical protein